MQSRTARGPATFVPSVMVWAVAALLAGAGASARSADEAEAGSDFKVNWTNTFRYGAAYRVKSQDPVLLAHPNGDDGDRNFGRGLISNRIELLSELDAVSSRGFGARVSGAGWYDSVYNRHNDNPGFAGGAFPNQISVAFDEFPKATRDLYGRRIEVRDAFVFGKFELGTMPLNVRLGQHALVWGESLFFASNAIAGGQSAFDIGRLLADPTAQAKEFVLPVPQLSAQLQVNPSLTLGAYAQFRHRANRVPAVGGYFSVSDVVGAGAERLFTGPGSSVPREPDLDAKDSGQFGLQARWRVAETDLGLYAIRFHDKDPQQVTRLGLITIPGGPPPFVAPTGYHLTYHERTTAVGASASRSFGDVNVAVEGSVRRNQSLASSGHAADVSALAPPGAVAASDNRKNPAYAVGNTAHLNVSAIWALQPSALWREALFIGELAWNRLLSCTRSCGALDTNATRDAVSLRMVFEPQYRQVMPGLDLGVPVGLGYTPKGSRSSLGPFAFPAEKGGDFTIGLNATYEQVWRINLAYTKFFGSAGTLLDLPANPATPPSFTYQQSRKDRDFIAFTVRRSF
ncbi:MAG: DUF1302 domain-containing protein [Steroidobacteraceae bacterium]|nr:DUF1302 domain-containing protein [Steroidobacteraceae bacterium]